jgi:UDP-glucose 4-epimerase
VVVLDDLSGGFRDQVPDRAQFVNGSVVDHVMLADLFDEYRFDYVYHLAAYAAEGLSHFIRRFNYTNNLIGSANLINESVKHEVRCFVFASSIAVYGALPPPMDETMIPRPEDPYGISKYAVEMDLHAARTQFGLNYVVFRPHNVYGEGQNIGDKYRNVVGIFMNQVMQGLPMTIFGDGSQTRAFSYIDDVAPHIARATAVEAARNQTFNVGADVPYTVLDIAHAVADAFGVPTRVVYHPARNEVVHAHAVHQKAAAVLGASSSASLAEGIARMALWAKGVGARCSTEFSQIEVRKSMPAGWLGVAAAT